MSEFVAHVSILLIRMGGFGLFLLGALDSSFLFAPLGHDLLMVVLSAQNGELVPYYAAMSAAGSVAGSLIIDVIGRKGGEKSLQNRLSPQRFDYVRGKIERHGGWAIVIASLAPPPFPYTAIVAAAAAFEYPRKRMMAIIGGCRFFRFGVAGFLAALFGSQILRIAEWPVVQYAVFALIIITIVGSAISMAMWFKRGG